MSDPKILPESGKKPASGPTDPIPLKSNQFWGKRSGSVKKVGDHFEYIFKIRKRGPGSNNSGAKGYKLKKQQRGVIKT